MSSTVAKVFVVCYFPPLGMICSTHSQTQMVKYLKNLFFLVPLSFGGKECRVQISKCPSILSKYHTQCVRVELQQEVPVPDTISLVTQRSHINPIYGQECLQSNAMHNVRAVFS